MLKKKCSEIEKNKQPRKKFSFSSRVKAVSSKSQDKKPEVVSKEGNSESEPSRNESLFRVAGSICVESRNNETIDINTLRPTDDNTQIQLLMRNCSNCDIVM
jgi:hypothetical protein